MYWYNDTERGKPKYSEVTSPSYRLVFSRTVNSCVLETGEFGGYIYEK